MLLLRGPKTSSGSWGPAKFRTRKLCLRLERILLMFRFHTLQSAHRHVWDGSCTDDIMLTHTCRSSSDLLLLFSAISYFWDFSYLWLCLRSFTKIWSLINSLFFFCLFVHQHYGILSCLGLIWFLVIRRGNSEQECPVMSDPSQNSFSCWTLQSVHKNIWERASQQQLPRNVLHFTPTVTMNHLFSHHMPWEFCRLNPHSHAFTYSINEHKNSLKPNIVFLHALKSSRSQKMWLN